MHMELTGEVIDTHFAGRAAQLFALEVQSPAVVVTREALG